MIYMLLGTGFEETEAIAPLDLLRRAGVEVTTASIHEDKLISSSHNISFYADVLVDELDMAQFDMVVLPGGLGGTNNLAASALVAKTVKAFAADESKLVAAVCAAPSVLGMLGLLQGKKATCYPGFEDKLLGAEATGEPVVEDGNIITGKGLGGTIPFALHLAARLEGAEKAEEIRQQIMYPFEI